MNKTIKTVYYIDCLGLVWKNIFVLSSVLLFAVIYCCIWSVDQNKLPNLFRSISGHRSMHHKYSRFSRL